jgi:phosphoribosylanthranilate isomerase
MFAPPVQNLRTRVKICGITRCQDVEAAVRAGADALGFVCYEGSPRYVDAARLGELGRALPPLVVPVLLFVDATPDRVRRALEVMPSALLQFHGDEDPAACGAYRRPYVRALALGAGVDLLDWECRFAAAAGLLVDAPRHPVAAPGRAADPAAPASSTRYGGSGRTADWSLVPERSRRSLPLILAGGLREDNVAAAIAAVRPYAVDVSSGVEETRGIKSADRMRGFIAAVRRADDRDGAP